MLKYGRVALKSASPWALTPLRYSLLTFHLYPSRQLSFVHWNMSPDSALPTELGVYNVKTDISFTLLIRYTLNEPLISVTTNRPAIMLWVKSFHIIAVICWFAVLFYLPRLFVYHAMSDDKLSKDRFIIMERKLIRGIGNPSMLVTLLFGAWLTFYSWDYYQSALWFWLKVSAVGVLILYHFMCIHLWKQFNADNNQRSHIFYRWFNEFPVLLLIIIVCLVVVKPLT
jgi:putative membrane protein